MCPGRRPTGKRGAETAERGRPAGGRPGGQAGPSTFPHVFTPGRIGSLRLPHRVLMGAMHLGSEASADGGAALAAFYTERARGGAGLIVTGGAAVSPAGAGGPNYAVLTSPAHRSSLGRVASEVHGAGGLIALQLFHAGRYALRAPSDPPPVAPSAVYSRFSKREPVALTAREVSETIGDFGRAGAFARQLGFDAVEVMASEGYLVDQFLSPLTNRRDDAWGGDPERRARFGVEVVRSVRAAAGADFPVIARFSGTDLVEGGTGEAEALEFAKALVAAGADALDVGIGWHESAVPTVQAIVPPGVWAPVSVRVKAAVGDVAVIAGNRVNRLEVAESLLESTALDFVSMARPFLADPAVVAKGRRGLRPNLCIACNQACIDRSLADEAVSCMVNPRAGREGGVVFPAPAAPLRALVAGGGPAGLEAARALAAAGHRVQLYEAGDALGGQFRLACRVPGKQDYAETVAYFAGELDRLGVAVHLGRAVTEDDAGLLAGFDAVVVATGVVPRALELPGAGLAHVIPYPEAFAEGALGRRVVVIGGGGIGLDVAHMASAAPGVGAGRGQAGLGPAERFRLEWGLVPSPRPTGDGGPPAPGACSVTVMLRSARPGAGLGRSSRWALLAELRHRGVEVMGGVTYRAIEPGGVRVIDAGGAERLVGADTVVVAAGQLRQDRVAAVAARAGVWHCSIGGARDVVGLDAVRAFSEGLAVAEALGERQVAVTR
ncbi:MAG: FAD-dependent oxidoreductase [Acidimicrobiales bacterium]